MSLDVPAAWAPIARRLLESTRVVMVLGERDVGKSTFVHWLATTAMRDGISVWVVDADVGQSDVGPPTTVAAAPFGQAAADMYFVGDHTPQRHLLPSVVGTARMVEKARQAKAELILINTTGWVEGGAAAALKWGKIDVVRPCALVALQRQQELEVVLEPYRHLRQPAILDCSPSTAVRVRDAAARETARRNLWERYLEPAIIHSLERRSIGMVSASSLWRGQVCGLFDADNECVAVGPLLEWDESKLSVRAPLAPGRPVRRVILGHASVPDL